MPSLIEFDCTLKALLLPLNGFFFFLVYEGERDIFSLLLSVVLLIGIIVYFHYYDQKSSEDDLDDKLGTLLPTKEIFEIEDDKIKVKKVEKEIDYSYGINKIENKSFSYPVILICYLIINFASYSRVLTGLKVKKKTDFIQLFSQILFFYLISKEKLYRHHIIGIIIFICSCYYVLEFDLKKEYIDYIFSFFYYLFDGLVQCIAKVLMVKYYLSPYLFSIANAAGQLFLDLLKAITSIFFPQYIHKNSSKNLIGENYFNFTKYNNFTNIKKGVYFVIGNSANMFLNSIIVYYYPPFIYPVSSDIGNYFGDILRLFTGKMEKDDYKNLIARIIQDIGISILAEIIILNFLGLGFNTKINIQRRAQLTTDRITSNTSISSVKSSDNPDKSSSENSIFNM